MDNQEFLTRQLRRLLKRLPLKAAVVIAVALAITIAPLSVAQTQTRNGKLSKQTHERVASGIVNRNSMVDVLLITRDATNPTVNQEITQRGGIVRYSDDDVGYIRASVPAKSVATLSESENIVSLEADEKFLISDPRPTFKPNAIIVPPSPPGPGTPPANAYLPTKDIGAPQFVAAHPTYDGRGVKIGIIDGGVDLLTPELQTAKTIDGKPVRKIIDWVNMNDPVTDGDVTWLDMHKVVTVANHQFSADGIIYSGVKGDGDYRFALFHETDLGEPYKISCGGDLNRNGVCNESFAVLWNPNSNQVWVDSNADHSFTNEPAMTDFKNNYDAGRFGTDNPTTPLRESVPFVVQTDKRNQFVNIGIVVNEHGTETTTVAAGKGLFGGAFNGSAPEAQIVSVCNGVHSGHFVTNHGLIEGAIYLAKVAKVDIISISEGGAIRQNDGNDSVSLLYNRLVARYKVSIFVAAGNSGPGLNTVASPSVASAVISVGGHIPADTIAALYGATQPGIEGVERYASRGPRDDGGFKPNVIAPLYGISALPAWQPGFTFWYDLPAGYSLVSGTSFSCPMAAGGGALLLSGAKQFGVSAKPDQLSQAIRSSSYFLPNSGAHEQGNGLVNVGNAWNVLKKNIETEQITSHAPVVTVDSGRLPTPNVGPGIYEREGWSAGQSGQRTIYFTRSSGGAVAKKYNLSWVGNDGTFQSLSSIILPRDVPVPLNVNIFPQTVGVHSAILNVDNADTDGIDYQTMNTIVAASDLNVTNNFTSTSAEVADNQHSNTYVNVPSGGRLLKVGLSEVHGYVWYQRYLPYGQIVFGDNAAPILIDESGSRMLTNPRGGVWETATIADFGSEPYPATFNVTTSLLSATISPSSFVADPTHLEGTYSDDFTFTNHYGPFDGKAEGTALGSAYSTTTTLNAGGPQQEYVVEVEPGATSVTARIDNSSDPNADIDLYLFNCTSGDCILASQSTSPTATESITIKNPAPGFWVVLVDPYDVPSGSTKLDYSDVFLNPVFGQIVVNDVIAFHPTGDIWIRSASATPLATPASGRYLKGYVRLLAEGSELATADFNLKNVSQ